MKHIYSQVCLYAALISVLGCTPQGNDEAQMLESAKALDQQFIEALSNGDIDAVMACYWRNPDLTSYPVGALEAKGWEATKEEVAMTLANMTGTSFDMIEANYMVAGDAVIGWGKWRAVIPLPDEKTMEMVGRYMDVKAKRDGKWVYILDHASVPLPPAPDHP